VVGAVSFHTLLTNKLIRVALSEEVQRVEFGSCQGS